MPAHTHFYIGRTRKWRVHKARRKRPQAKRGGLDGIQPKEQSVPGSEAGASLAPSRKNEEARAEGKKSEGESPPEARADAGPVRAGLTGGSKVLLCVEGKTGRGVCPDEAPCTAQTRASLGPLKRHGPGQRREATVEGLWSPRWIYLRGNATEQSPGRWVSAEQFQGGSCRLRRRGVSGWVDSVKSVKTRLSVRRPSGQKNSSLL